MAATTISTMPPPSRDHILDLPNELFDMMLARLDWDEIYVFYMTRKKHDAAKAALWPRYCTEGLQIWDHEQTFLEANARKEMRKPERLLHSILSNPDVGSELRELFLAVPSARQAQPHPSDSPSQVPRLDMPTWWSSILLNWLFRELKNLRKLHLRGFWIERQSEWRETNNFSYPPQYLAEPIVLPNSLEELRIDEAYTYDRVEMSVAQRFLSSLRPSEHSNMCAVADQFDSFNMIASYHFSAPYFEDNVFDHLSKFRALKVLRVSCSTKGCTNQSEFDSLFRRLQGCPELGLLDMRICWSDFKSGRHSRRSGTRWLADALLSTSPNDDMHFELVIDGVQALRFARDGIRLVGRYQINRKITKASVRKVLSAMGKVQALLEWKREVGQIEKRQVSIVDMV